MSRTRDALRSWRSRRSIARSLELVPAFAGCERDQLLSLAGEARVVLVLDGAVAVRSGESSRTVRAVLDGTAAACVGSAEVGTLWPGDVFGALPFPEFRPIEAEVVATSAMRMVEFDVSAFDVFVATSPSVERALRRALARRMRDLYETTREAGTEERNRMTDTRGGSR